jgi:hypothetical protein
VAEVAVYNVGAREATDEIGLAIEQFVGVGWVGVGKMDFPSRRLCLEVEVDKEMTAALKKGEQMGVTAGIVWTDLLCP